MYSLVSVFLVRLLPYESLTNKVLTDMKQSNQKKLDFAVDIHMVALIILEFGNCWFSGEGKTGVFREKLLEVEKRTNKSP